MAAQTALGSPNCLDWVAKSTWMPGSQGDGKTQTPEPLCRAVSLDTVPPGVLLGKQEENLCFFDGVGPGLRTHATPGSGLQNGTAPDSHSAAAISTSSGCTVTWSRADLPLNLNLTHAYDVRRRSPVYVRTLGSRPHHRVHCGGDGACSCGSGAAAPAVCDCASAGTCRCGDATLCRCVEPDGNDGGECECDGCSTCFYWNSGGGGACGTHRPLCQGSVSQSRADQPPSPPAGNSIGIGLAELSVDECTPRDDECTMRSLNCVEVYEELVGVTKAATMGSVLVRWRAPEPPMVPPIKDIVPLLSAEPSSDGLVIRAWPGS